MQRSRPNQTKTSQLVATHKYRDQRGKLVYEVLRYDPKSFRQQRPKKGGGYVRNLTGVRRVPYRLPELLAAPGGLLYVVDGEKDVDTLVGMGKVATCNSEGSGKHWCDAWAQWFVHFDKVVIVADRDDAGRKAAVKQYGLFTSWGIQAKIYETTVGKDVTAHVAGGKRLKDLTDVTLALTAKPSTNGKHGAPADKGWTAQACAAWAKDFLFRDVSEGQVHNGREDVAYKFALQLRDVSRGVAEEAMRLFVEECPEEDSEGALKPYTLEQAMDTLRSALDGEAPAGWKPGVFSVAPAAAGHFRIQMMDELEMRDVTWLWDQYIPFGKLTSVEGDPETGKSLFTLDLSARVSCGGKLPDGSPAPACCVMLICDEDDYEDTIGPRLEAAGANRSKVGAVFVDKDENGTVVPFYIPDDLDFIGGAIDALKARTGMDECLVVVDPVTSYLSEQVNSHNDASVRRVTSPLAILARETNAAFVMVRHLNKNSSETNPKYRGGGSIAFYAAARAALQFGQHPNDESLHVMAQAKKNLALAKPSLAYRVIASPANPRQPVIAWEGTVELDARTMLRGPDAREESPDRDNCVVVLEDLLSSCKDDPKWVAAKLAKAQCKAELDVSARTVERAAKTMGLLPRRVRAVDGTIQEWIWEEPTTRQGTGKVRLQGKV